MEKALINGPPELSPLMIEIIVRCPWFLLLQHQTTINQPDEAHCAFHSLMLSIFARCICRVSNYTVSLTFFRSPFLLIFGLEITSIAGIIA